MKGFNPPVTPAKIVQDNWRFSIPIYQRLFVWESEQIDRLLDDLWAASQNKKDHPYYVGVITTVKQNDGKNGRVFSVVDGQQRLTFLLLFFCDCIARGDRTEEEDAYKFVFVNLGQNELQEKESRLRINFLGRKKDEEDIQHYATTDKTGDDGNTIKNLNFRQFHDRMEMLVKKHKDCWESKKRQFIQYVFEKTSFLVNELADFSNADLNLYFEKMNSTGRQLSPLEQLKGEFANYASDWNDCFNFETTRYRAEKARADDSVDNKTGINSLDDILKWKTEVDKEPMPNRGSGAYSRLPMRPEVLALHALWLTLKAQGKEEIQEKGNEDASVNLSPRHLLETFRPYLSSDFSDTYIATLKQYRDWIDENIIYLRGEAEENDTEDSDSLGLRYAFRDTCKSEDASNGEKMLQEKKMLQLQSMLYVSSGEGQEWILKVYEACRDENGSPQELSFDMLRKKVSKWWEDEVGKTSISELSYSPGMNRHIFWMLDYLLWEKVVETESQQERVRISFCNGVNQEFSKDQIAAIKRYRFTQNRSVEHLHPQNPPTESDAWKVDRNNGSIVRNSFGNLCMISQATNSSLSNEPVDVKFAKVRYALQGHPLQSIKLMLMFASCYGTDSDWTPKKAIEHGGYMLKVLGFGNDSIAN